MKGSVDMNLIPPKIMRNRQLYALCIRLAAIQAVIFLLLILSVVGFDLTLRLRDARIAQLDLEMQGEQFAESEAVAVALREHNAREAAQQDAVDWLELPFFNIERLDMMKETLPRGVNLVQIDIDETGATLTLEAENLSLADIHRETWISTGLVSRVQLISATAQEGMVRYVLALRWIDES